MTNSITPTTVPVSDWSFELKYILDTFRKNRIATTGGHAGNTEEVPGGFVVTVTPVELPGAKQYRDARSAAFYAMGAAVKTGQSVLLVIPGHDLVSTYTAITESWFQKANVIVVALFEKVSDVKTFWMDRCVLRAATFSADEQSAIEEMVASGCGLSGPVLINLTGFATKEKPINYSAVMKALCAADPNVKMTAFFPENDDSQNVVAVPVRDKYGIISKYVGMSVAKDVGVLLCPAQCVLLDINIFRTRYANGNMKIVLLDENGALDDLNVAQWICGNGWAYLESDGAEETGAKWLLSQQRQAVWMIR